MWSCVKIVSCYTYLGLVFVTSEVTDSLILFLSSISLSEFFQEDELDQRLAVLIALQHSL